MAVAYGNFHELSHQLRFLLFEIGIGLPQNSIDYFITRAHQETLQRLQHAALQEGLISSPLTSHHVHDFLDQLLLKLKKSEPSSRFYQWDNLREELDESIANEALTQAYKFRWNSQIRNEAHSFGSLWSWIKSEYTPKQALSFLEQWGKVSHPYYPGLHAKIGFTRREVLQNSAEFQARLSLHWCAIHHSVVNTSSDSMDYNALIKQEFPQEFKLWHDKLNMNHLNPEDYIPMPIHPWQWRNRLQSLCSNLIDNKSLILLPHHQTAMPGMSYDIMMPGEQANCLIRLPVDIYTPETSLTNLIEDHQHQVNKVNFVLAQANHYQNTLFLTNELSALRINSSPIAKNYQHQLSVDILQHPVMQAKSGQIVVPLTSLFAHSSVSNASLITEIVKSSGLAPLDYLQIYSHIILRSQLHLLLKHGIAFANNAHNNMVIFNNDRPQGLILGYKPSIRFATCPLAPEQLKNCFIQGVFQHNLAYWVDDFQKEFRLHKQVLWDVVNKVIQRLFDELSQEDLPLELAKHQYWLLNEDWQHQCLLTARLKGNNMEKESYKAQPNPLKRIS